jgi:hypothetical protein
MLLQIVAREKCASNVEKSKSRAVLRKLYLFFRAVRCAPSTSRVRLKRAAPAIRLAPAAATAPSPAAAAAKLALAAAAAAAAGALAHRRRHDVRLDLRHVQLLLFTLLKTKKTKKEKGKTSRASEKIV